MLLNIRIITLFCALFLTSASIAGNGYEIKVKITGLKDTVCYLANYFGDKQYLKDTATVDNSGKMVFSGKEKLPPGIYLVVIPSKKYFEIMVDKDQEFSLETDTLDFIKNMKIKDSEDNRMFYDYLHFISKKHSEIEPLQTKLKNIKNNKDSTALLREQIKAIDKAVKDYKIDFIKKHPQTFNAVMFKAMSESEIPEAPILPNGRPDSTFSYRYYKAHFWDNIDFSDERLIRTPIIYNKIKQYLETLTPQHPDSINVSADVIITKAKANKEMYKFAISHITYQYETSKIMGMDGVFVHVAENYWNKDLEFWVDSAQIAKVRARALTLKPLLIGKKAPNLIMKDTLGNSVNLYNLKAKYTVLFFWDYGCGHCKKEAPKLAEYYRKVKSKGVEVFAVGTETDAEAWKKFIRENKLNFLNVFDPFHQTGFKKTYDIFSTPVIYLLDENKKILIKKIDVEQLEDILDKMMKDDEKKALKKK